ncbi:uncharacterized protein LOC126267800 [Schistocerca gregaria]|uniref:uncharacterized protein LOC126267800 n=1 Tax=Schistocerca gregaria TaxID=7010 RepID=UPI00211F14B1|nr:uncharacterized protein LOC126267800 [Schistocerca gregaria]
MSQDAEQLRELIRKYEQRQRDLEDRELQARDRLTMLETYMPAVLSWNAWSALQAQQVTPGEVTRIITGQQLLPMDESYTRRLQELENVVRGIKDSEELASVGPKPSGSLTPDDIENMKKLQEIATNEMQLKRRIQSMERKELMYLAALQKADELRMRAEGITSGQEFTSPTIVEAGSSAEGLQRRVVELEAEVNRLKKKAEVLEAENEKLLHMISDGTQVR